MNDKFAEMYLKIVKAKGFEQKGNTNAALKEYLDVIENYSPNDDLVYKRACDLLMKRTEYEESKRIAILALKKLKDEEITGSPAYFHKIIEKLDEKMVVDNAKAKDKKKSKKSKGSSSKKFSLKLRFLENKIELTFIIIAILFFIIISLPDKIFKLMFLAFGVLALVFLFEVIIAIKEKLSYKIKSILFLLFLFLSLLGVYNMPPSNWDKFFAFPTVNESQSNSDAKDTPKSKPVGKSSKSSKSSKSDDDNADSTKSEHKIDDNDLSSLKDTLDTETNLSTYELSIKGDKILLDVFLKPSAKKGEGKSIAMNILNNLSLLKGCEGKGDNDLGSLYDEYSVNVNIYNSNDKRLANGRAKKGAKKLTWK